MNRKNSTFLRQVAIGAGTLLYLLTFTSTRLVAGQITDGVDMRGCIDDSLVTTINTTSQKTVATTAMYLLQEYNSHKSGDSTHLNVEVPYDGARIIGDYGRASTTEDVRRYLERNNYTSNVAESLQYLYRGMSPEALKVVSSCLEKQVAAAGKLGLYPVSVEPGGSVVVVEFTWGANSKGEPWVIKSQEVTGGSVGHPMEQSIFNSICDWWALHFGKPVESLVTTDEIAGLRLKGNNWITRRITRRNPNATIDIGISLEDGPSVRIQIPPFVEPAVPHTAACMWTAETRKEPTQNSIVVNFHANAFNVTCHGMQPDALVTIEARGDVEAAAGSVWNPPGYNGEHGAGYRFAANPYYGGGDIIDYNMTLLGHVLDQVFTVHAAHAETVIPTIGNSMKVKVPPSGDVSFYLYLENLSLKLDKVPLRLKDNFTVRIYDEAVISPERKLTASK